MTNPKDFRGRAPYDYVPIPRKAKHNRLSQNNAPSPATGRNGNAKQKRALVQTHRSAKQPKKAAQEHPMQSIARTIRLARLERRRKALAEQVLFGNDFLLSIVTYLDGCKDLLNLALTCKQLGSKMGNEWSLVEDVARQSVVEASTEEERNALPRYDGESWISMLHELAKLRSPLTFDELLGSNIKDGYVRGYVGGDRSCFTSTPKTSSDFMFDDWPGKPQTALCSNHVMRSGQHYASFTITGSEWLCYFFPGIMRPIRGWVDSGLSSFAPWYANFFDEFLEDKTERWGESNVNYCLYSTFSGCCSWGDWENDHRHNVTWQGQESFDMTDSEDADGVVGLLLDLDEGTLAVYKNGKRLGVMMRGLSGEFVWSATMVAQMRRGPREQNIRIERGPVPKS